MQPLAKSEQRNIELDDETWKYVSIMAALTGGYKKNIVKQAIHSLYNQQFRKDEEE